MLSCLGGPGDLQVAKMTVLVFGATGKQGGAVIQYLEQETSPAST